MTTKKQWHEGLSREELIERCDQAVKQSNREHEEANRAMFQVDNLQKELHKARKRSSAHSYVQKLEQLCISLWDCAIQQIHPSDYDCNMQKQMTNLGFLPEIESDPDTGMKWGEPDA